MVFYIRVFFSALRKELGKTPAGQSPKWLNTLPRKAEYIQVAVV